MPMRTEVIGTLRNDKPVAALLLTDVIGETQEFHLHPETALDLMVQLVHFVQTMGIRIGS